FSSHPSPPLTDLHSFPTRRSSDLLSTTNATHSISIMSSSFMQRGEPAIVDKWTRAKMAIDNGVDLVLELPFVYSCQSAELFALRSEEHTSELQSRFDLVCRLLLEK